MIRMLRNRFYFIITSLLWSSKLRVIQETNQSKACKELEFRRNTFSSGNKRSEDQTSASFELALFIAKKKRPMVEGKEIIKPALHIVTKYPSDKAIG